jgi:excisionase family DNA binding protein
MNNTTQMKSYIEKPTTGEVLGMIETAMIQKEESNNEDRLATPEECAAWLRVEVRTLLKNVRNGKVPAVKINDRTFRFHLPSVLKALQK